MRLYHPGIIARGVPLSLSDTQHHYLKRVMRLKTGDPFCVFNERDGEWSIQGACYTFIRSSVTPAFLWLAFPILRQTERLRFLIEKATEIGVTHFLPLQTDHTQGRFDERKAKLWSVEAVEQCERLDIPQFFSVQSLENLLTLDVQWAVALERSSSSSYAQKVNGLIIGPEGGFSEREKNEIHKRNLSCVSLGQNILRAETAALVGLFYIKNML